MIFLDKKELYFTTIGIVFPLDSSVFAPRWVSWQQAGCRPGGPTWCCCCLARRHLLRSYSLHSAGSDVLSPFPCCTKQGTIRIIRDSGRPSGSSVVLRPRRTRAVLQKGCCSAVVVLLLCRLCVLLRDGGGK